MFTASRKGVTSVVMRYREITLGFVKKFYGIRFTGNYSWAEAAARCGTGYSAESILSHTLRSTRDLCLVERDVLVNTRAHRLLAALLLVDRSCVLDFGGALGIHYFTVRRFLSGSVDWWIAELPRTADVGKECFASNELHFVSDLSIIARPTVVLASSSLQYCRDPYGQLEVLTKTGADSLIIDRLPLTAAKSDRLTIQTVPYYKARYPAWFLSEKAFFHALIDLGWNVQIRWRVPEDRLWLDGKSYDDEGLLATR